MTECREGLCEVCDRDYPVWFAPNPLWNRVMRGGVRANGDMYAFICPTCFANIADEQNGSQLIWVLFEDGRYEEYMREQLHQVWADNAELFERISKLEGLTPDGSATEHPAPGVRHQEESVEFSSGMRAAQQAQQETESGVWDE